MEREMTFTIEKPYSEQEIIDFKAFRIELKSLIKIGKLKVVEKFKVFAFIITDYSTEEKESVGAFLKKEAAKLEIKA